MARQANWIQSVRKDEMIFSHDPVANLWSRWNTHWLRHVGIIAVVDARWTMVGILRPHDILDHLLQHGVEVYHLWPYTHVVENSWAERLKKLDGVPAGELIRDKGVVIPNPTEDWVPSVDLFARHMTSVIWISDQHHVLYGKVTLKSLVPPAS